MKYYGKAEEVAAKILEAFESGTIAKALATIFIRRKDNVPCRHWSWGNQLLCVLQGTDDARGMRQWNEVQRFVKKGSKAFQILVPLIRKGYVVHEETAEQKVIDVVYGFRTASVFAVEDTEGQELPKGDPELENWLNNLPLIEVARSWGLDISAYDGREGAPLGKFRPSKFIAIGVKNVSTFAHELVHAADYRLNNLKEKGQHWRSEIVAELGATVLLGALFLAEHSDRGGAWRYIESYAKAAEIEPLQACTQVMKRTCDAVNLLLSEAEKLAAQQATTVV